MEQSKELPKRTANHIKETSGFKVLEDKIPSEWMIRNITERDYGVDCYIELVDEENRLTGEIAFIQMKSTNQINWRVNDNGFKFYKVSKSTTNYLNGFKIPTYLFIVDLSTKELFFLSVKEYILEHYYEYSIDGSFAYDFFKGSNRFTVDAFLTSFRRNNQYDRFRNELQYFISNLHYYVDFMWDHNNRDCFLQIEQEEMIFFEAMHRNISFLQNYFVMLCKLPPLKELEKKGKEKYGGNYAHTLFEGVLTELFADFKTAVLELVDRIVELVTKKESHYWSMEKSYIFNYFFNLDKESLFRG